MAVQEAMIAGQAASASSARQPGSVDQLTGSKLTGGGGGTTCLGLVTQAASSASALQIRIRLTLVNIVEARPRLLGNEECPHYSLMPAWSMMKAYCSAYSR